jgi:hypothetical protein
LVDALPYLRWRRDSARNTASIEHGNFQGSLSDAMSKMLALTPSTCRYPQPLRAIERSLVGNAATLGASGFIRKHAKLVIALVTANDDCSMSPAFFAARDVSQTPRQQCFAAGVRCTEDTQVIGEHHLCKAQVGGPALAPQSIADKLIELKGSPQRVIIAQISGSAAPVVVDQNGPAEQCSLEPRASNAQWGEFSGFAAQEVKFGAEGSQERGKFACNNGAAICGERANARSSAQASVRLHDFALSLVNNGETSICKEDWSDALANIGVSLGEVIPQRCFHSQLAQPYECTASTFAQQANGEYIEYLLPACDSPQALAGARPCWRIKQSLAECPAPAPGNAVEFDRTGLERVPGYDRIECVTSE